MKFFAFASVLFAGIAASASIPPARMILQRVVEHAGSGAYAVEQEVQIPNGADTLSLKESWIIENDRSMRVTVSALREPKDAVQIQILYAGGQRWILKGGRKEQGPIPEDFAERAFHTRTLDSLGALLASLKILPPDALQKKPLPRRAEDFKYETPAYVRLARTGGVVAWAFGTPASPSAPDSSPGLWIEQDQFVIRKLRFPSQAEMTADSYSSYSRGLQLPKQRTIRWKEHTATIRLLSASARTGAALSMNSLDKEWKIQGLDNQPARPLIEEFYTRFR